MKKPEVLRVTFPDGEQICYKHSVNTVIAVLAKIGAERFPEIDLKISKRPLVSQEFYDDLKNYTKEIIPGWYYINRTDNREKQSQLININAKLNLNLTIELGEFKGVKNPKIEGSTRPKKRLEVIMPDGELIDYDSYVDVFVTVIDKLGPRKVSRIANIDLSKTRPLFASTNDTGNRIRIEEFLFLSIPDKAEEAYNILNMIATRLSLRDSMRVSLIAVRES